jgi:hypothetical protein
MIESLIRLAPCRRVAVALAALGIARDRLGAAVSAELDSALSAKAAARKT